jgi:hypothetical protein
MYLRRWPSSTALEGGGEEGGPSRELLLGPGAVVQDATVAEQRWFPGNKMRDEVVQGVRTLVAEAKGERRAP